MVPIYAYAYFAPTIIKTLGYTVVQTQLHTVPPVAAALALCLIFAYFSDNLRLRSPFILSGIFLTLIGLIILLCLHPPHHFSAQYLGICFIAMGAFAAGPIVVCWYLMNLRGHVQRGVGSAWMIGFGNCGGIVATFTFLAKDAPEYRRGYAVCLGVTVVGAAAAMGYAGCIWRERRRVGRSGGKEAAHSLSL